MKKMYTTPKTEQSKLLPLRHMLSVSSTVFSGISETPGDPSTAGR